MNSVWPLTLNQFWKRYLSFQIWTNCELLSKRKFNSIYQLWLFNVNFTFSLKSILLPRNCNALMHFSTNFCIIFRSNIFTSLIITTCAPTTKGALLAFFRSSSNLILLCQMESTFIQPSTRLYQLRSCSEWNESRQMAEITLTNTSH